ncbi:hypothetical protein ACFCZV_01000 [Streptomyces hydrogenans]|uniref:hypothetical protein n=1 Tax=Streptomyces hydrogenans TaxID=1873719 RepID=UPI0035DFDA05
MDRPGGNDPQRSGPDVVVRGMLVSLPGGRAADRPGSPKTGYGGPWTVGVLDRLLREETPCIGLWLDTSEHRPDRTAAQILGNLPAARVRTD